MVLGSMRLTGPIVQMGGGRGVRMEWSRLLGGSLLSGVALCAVGTLCHFVVPLLAPQLGLEYRNEALFRPWGGWTRVYMVAHPWLYGVLFAAVFLGARAVVGASNLGGVRDGLFYGLAAFLVGSLPVYALNFASFQVSGGVIGSWVLQSLCQYALAGLALGWYCSRSAVV
jgi:hypothetical protein